MQALYPPHTALHTCCPGASSLQRSSPSPPAHEPLFQCAHTLISEVSSRSWSPPAPLLTQLPSATAPLNTGGFVAKYTHTYVTFMVKKRGQMGEQTCMLRATDEEHPEHRGSGTPGEDTVLRIERPF
ncbi:unnamed protein product [Rangifer tarandus platyrhynchus]|uniref:Uncharacterized protein n=1 Tax=Rangifer tarandus platyrhynchus TaxID=3082113 RepID=A0ACB1MN37_RANTA